LRLFVSLNEFKATFWEENIKKLINTLNTLDLSNSTKKSQESSLTISANKSKRVNWLVAGKKETNNKSILAQLINAISIGKYSKQQPHFFLLIFVSWEQLVAIRFNKHQISCLLVWINHSQEKMPIKNSISTKKNKVKSNSIQIQCKNTYILLLLSSSSPFNWFYLERIETVEYPDGKYEG